MCSGLPIQCLGSPPSIIDPSPVGTDSLGHGTRVAGIIGGDTYGVAKRVKLHSLKVYGESHNSSWTPVLEALQYLDYEIESNTSQMLPAVLNMSLGGYEEIPVEMQGLLNSLYNKNVTLVASAGNDGRSDCIHFPSEFSNVISVAATDSQDRRGVWGSKESNYGGCVDLFAPGTDIISATPSPSSTSAFVTGSGTSYSAPMVSGAAAIYLHDIYTREDRIATPLEVKNSILAAASPVSINAGSGSPNLLLNVDKLVENADLQPDIYEDDDVYINSSLLNLNQPFNAHNFVGNDSSDWVFLNHNDDLIDGACPNLSCTIEFDNIVNNNTCYQIFNSSILSFGSELPDIIDSENEVCNISNGTIPIGSPDNSPTGPFPPNVSPYCAYSFNKYINITNNIDSSSDSSYDIKLNCTPIN